MAGDHRILILGAGPTGLGAAWRLNEAGYKNWLLLEAEKEFGGLASSVVDDAGFTWDMGGHVLFSHYEYFDRLLDTLLGDAWVHHIREAWVWIRNRFIPYPFQNNIWRLPADDLIACLEGLLAIHNGQGSQARPENFHEWILNSFGAGLADVFFIPYNRKVWAYPPSELSTGWMGERVATVDFAKILRSLVLRKDEVSWGPNATFRYPLHGGTGAIWRALGGRLPQDRVLTGSRVSGISTSLKRVTLEDGSSLDYDYLITSLPLDTLLSLMIDCPHLQRKAGEFKYSSSHIVGLGIEGSIPEVLATKCWMYFAEPEIPFYRATALSNYSPYNVPLPGQQWSLMCEISESEVKAVDAGTVIADVISAAKHCQLLDEPGRIVSKWHCRLEHGYPTPFLERDRLLDEIQPELKENNILSRGRFGGWKYEVSNQDHSCMQGVEAAEYILFGREEVTYFQPHLVNSGKRVAARV